MNFLKKYAIGLITISLICACPSIYGEGHNKSNKIVLSSHNTVVLNKEINDETVAKTLQKLYELDSEMWHRKEPIYLFLYSPGGSIQSGLELIDATKGLHRRVDTISLFSASMAFRILQNLGVRYVMEDSILMSHRAAGKFSGYFGGQKPSQLDSRYALWLQRMNELDEQTVARTNGKQTLQSYRAQYAEEMWITGKQAVEQGYADRIANVRCDSSLNGTTSHNINFMGLEVQYDISNCPLIIGLLNVKVTDPNGKQTNQMVIEDIKQKFVDSFNLEKNIKNALD
jgi:ATP-dependent Clp protease protease subunit